MSHSSHGSLFQDFPSDLTPFLAACGDTVDCIPAGGGYPIENDIGLPYLPQECLSKFSAEDAVDTIEPYGERFHAFDFQLLRAEPSLTPFEQHFTPAPDKMSDLSLDGGTFSVLLPMSSHAPQNQAVLPDLSKGLGNRQEKINLVELADLVANKHTFMVYKEILYLYQTPCWIQLNKHTCIVQLRKSLSMHGLTYPLTNRDYMEIYSLLLTNPEIQRQGEFHHDPDRLNLRDGTLDIPSMRLLPHNPEDDFFWHLDISYNDLFAADGPVFEHFIEQAGGGNPLVRQQVLELIATAITGLELKYFFVAVGPSGTGKTQLARFLIELLGHEQVETIRGMSDFGERFALGNVEGKCAIACLDLPDQPLPSAATGMLRQLVGDDAICAERKYQAPTTIYRKPLFFSVGNHPIRLSNLSNEEALLRRMVVIPICGICTESEKIPQLYRHLLEEAPYIVREALKAYSDLLANNRTPTRSEIPAEYLPVDSRPCFNDVKSFLLACCAAIPDEETSTQALYQAYENYATDCCLSPLTSTNFSRVFAEVLRSERYPATHVRRIQATGQRGYSGIRLTR